MTHPAKRTAAVLVPTSGGTTLILAAMLALTFALPASRGDEGIPIAAVKHDGPVDFEKEILPILRSKCLACHNSTDAESDLVLETPAAILKGGAEGPSAMPGKSAESLMLKLAARQTDPVMPPDDNDVQAKPLTSAELGLLKLWIDEGAKGEVSGLANIQWMPLPAGVNPIYAVGISRDGQYAAAGRANQVFVYHVPSKRPLGRLTDPALLEAGVYQKPGVAMLDLIQSLAFSPDGQRLAVGGFKTVKIWHRPRNVRLGEIAGLDAPPRSLAVSADNTQAAAGLENGTIKWFTVADGKVAKSLAGHEGPVNGLAITADGKQLVSGGADKTLRLWNPADGKETLKFETPSEINAVVIGGAEQLIISAHADNQIRVWKTAQAEGKPTLELVRELKGHSKPVTSLALVNDTQVLSGSTDATARVWDFTKGNAVRTLSHGGPINGVAARSDGQRFATVSSNKIGKLWDSAGKQLVELRGDFRAKIHVGDLTRAVNVAKRQVDAAKKDLDAANKRKTAEEANAKKADEARKKADEELKKKTEAAKKPVADKAAADKALADATAALPKAQEAQKAAIAAATVAATELKNAQTKQAAANAAAKTATTAKTQADTKLKAADTAKAQAVAKATAAKAVAKAAGDKLTAAQTAAKKAAEKLTAAQAAAKTAADKLSAAEAVAKTAAEKLAAAQDAAKKAADAAQAADAAAKAKADDAALAEAAKKANEAKAAADKIVTDATAAKVQADKEAAALKTAKATADKLVETETAARTAADAVKPLLTAKTTAGTKLATADTDATNKTTAALAQKKLVDAAAAKMKIAVDAKTAADKIVAEMTAKKTEADKAKVTADKALADATNKQKQSDANVKKLAAPVKKATDELATADRTFKAAERSVKRAADSVKKATEAIPVQDAEVKKFEALHKQNTEALAGANKAVTDSELPLHNVAFSPDGKTLITCGEDKLVHAWDAENGAAIETYAGHEAPVSLVAFLGDNKLLSMAANHQAIVWQAYSPWKLERTIGSQTTSDLVDRVTALDFSRDGKLLLTGSGEPSRSGEIKVWNVADGKLVRELNEPHSDTVFCLEVSPDNQYIASCGADRFVKVFELQTGKFVRAFEGHTHHVLGVSWQADGRVLASSGADKVIKVWNFLTGDQIRTITGFGKEVTDIRFVADGTNVVSSSGDKSVLIKRSDNGGNVRGFTGSTDFVFSVDCSGDGKLILAGGQDSVLRVWSDNGKVFATFAPPEPPEEDKDKTAAK